MCVRIGYVFLRLLVFARDANVFVFSFLFSLF